MKTHNNALVMVTLIAIILLAFGCDNSKPNDGEVSDRSIQDPSEFEPLVNAYQGVEVRWHFKSEPMEIKQWFQGIDTAYLENELDRTDYYLITGYKKMSFKIRGGRTEIKTLDWTTGKESWGNRWEGIVETWNKWGPQLKNKNLRLTEVFADTSQFQPVVKDRLLVKYEIGDGNEPKMIKVGTRANNGCQVELTRIIINGNESYSFAFESFGDRDRLKNNFDLVTKEVFKNIPTIQLPVEASYSYASLLTKP